MKQQGAVLYHEPSILTILTQSSFLLALVFVDFALDSLVYCGLIGQILVGLAYGKPAGDILGAAFQQTITDLGYLGLILLVFEGGLSTDMKALRSNGLLSILVALTGISMPIGISFILIAACNASILQAFAAGCALSSTSLGTTFTILKASGLDKSRLGVILTSAAMLDDVVGLVLVQVISNLGSSGQDFTAITVVRPVLVSLAYALLVPLTLYAWKKMVISSSAINSSNRIVLVSRSARGQMIVQTILLGAGVTSAAYAGTSTLLAAYFAGLLIVSCESLAVVQKNKESTKVPEKKSRKNEGILEISTSHTPEDIGPWELVRIASHDKIGSSPSTPITKEQSLDGLPKTVSNEAECTIDQKSSTPAKQNLLPETKRATSVPPDAPSPTNAAEVFHTYYAQPLNKILRPFFFASIGFSIPITRLFTTHILWRGIVYAILMTFGKACCGLWLIRFTSSRSTPSDPQANPKPRFQQALYRLASYRPQSLYPACMLGSAMVARGEIGFLISAIAQSNGIFDQDGGGSDQIFLVVTWAVLLCTILGPLSVGLMARRVKSLERKRECGASGADATGKEHPLGIWKDI